MAAESTDTPKEEPKKRADDDDAPASDDAKDEAKADELGNKSPLGGKALSRVEATPVSSIAKLVDKARQAQKKWAETSLSDRIDAIAKVKKRVLSRAEEIAELVHREMGKPVEEAALADVLPNADLIAYWTSSIEELLEGTPVELDPLTYPGKYGRIHHEARGVVALITPWNYPVSLPLRTLVPALLAGNAVLFKPSEVTPRSGAVVASLFDGLLPEGLLALVQGGVDVGKAVVAADVDLVVFTGSVATGRAIAVACAERLIPCSLELGGKDAAIVLDDANLERAAQGVVWGAFTNSGQNCAGIERVYVHKGISERFIDRVVAITKELKPGIDTGVLATDAQKKKVESHLEAAIADGAEVLTGGAPEKKDSLAFPPTVVRVEDPKSEASYLTDETFGPILPIAVVDSEEQAVELANRSRYGLTTSIWTKKIRRGEKLAQKLRSGIVTINNHAFTAVLPAAPWTGVGDTGYGITNSPHALHALTRVRFVLEDRNRAKRELWWYPYTPLLRTIAYAMAQVRGGAGIFGRIAALFRLLAAVPRRLLGRG